MLGYIWQRGKRIFGKLDFSENANRGDDSRRSTCRDDAYFARSETQKRTSSCISTLATQVRRLGHQAANQTSCLKSLLQIRMARKHLTREYKLIRKAMNKLTKKLVQNNGVQSKQDMIKFDSCACSQETSGVGMICICGATVYPLDDGIKGEYTCWCVAQISTFNRDVVWFGALFFGENNKPNAPSTRNIEQINSAGTRRGAAQARHDQF